MKDSIGDLFTLQGYSLAARADLSPPLPGQRKDNPSPSRGRSDGLVHGNDWIFIT
jgi:hypothetical protein